MKTPEELSAEIDLNIDEWTDADLAAILAAWKEEAWQEGYDFGWNNCADGKEWEDVEANL